MFWKDTVERTVRTALQAGSGAVLAYLTGIVGDGGWDAIEWGAAWKVGAFAALLTLLTAIAAKPAGSPDSASFLEP